MCMVLREVKPAWDVELLGPLLTDTLTWGYTYEADERVSERLPIRVCDEVAIALSENHAELKFTRAGNLVELDRQIAVIREQLARKK